MPIKFRCPHCEQLLGIARSKVGEVVDCPMCGRSVRVPALDGRGDLPPEPAIDLADPQLAGALNRLARIGQEPIERPRAETAAEESGPAAETIQPLPEPVPIEPPVPVVAPSLQQAEPTADAPAHHREKSGSLPDARLPEPSTPGTLRETVSGVARFDRFGAGRRGARLLPITLAALAGAIVGFAVGFLIRPSVDGSGSSGARATRVASSGLQQADAAAEPAEHPSIYGRITFKNEQGESRPDRGARVFVFPQQRTGERKLDIVGFRVADSEADFQSAAAAFRALGGNVALVDDEGNYELRLPAAGTYRLLVVSSFASRDPNEPIPPPLAKLLAEYFDRPEQLLGRVAYRFGQVRYKGNEPVLWDHAF